MEVKGEIMGDKVVLERLSCGWYWNGWYGNGQMVGSGEVAEGGGREVGWNGRSGGTGYMNRLLVQVLVQRRVTQTGGRRRTRDPRRRASPTRGGGVPRSVDHDEGIGGDRKWPTIPRKDLLTKEWR